MTNFRSMRKLIAAKLPDIAETAEVLTSRSLNHQPEYFLALKTAEAIHAHFKSYRFSMEVQLKDICEDADIHMEAVPAQYRINGLKRADLVVRHSKNGRYRHVVEFKRSGKQTSLMKDAKRLAWLCQNVQLGHKMEKNFLVAISTFGPNVLAKRTQAMAEMLEVNFPYVILKDTYVDLEAFKSTSPKTQGKPLHAMVWEFHYKE